MIKPIVEQNTTFDAMVKAFKQAGLSERTFRTALLMIGKSMDAVNDITDFVSKGNRSEEDILLECMSLIRKYNIDKSRSVKRAVKRRDAMDYESIIIVHSGGDVGEMNMSGVEGVGLFSLEYPFDATTLPSEMTEKAFLDEFYKIAPADEPWFAERLLFLLKYDWKRQKKVTVWINESIDTMIGAMFIAKIYDGPLYMLDYSKYGDKDTVVTNLRACLDCAGIRSLLGQEQEVSDEYRQYLRDRWDELVKDGRALKILDESGQITCVDVEDLRPVLQSIIPPEGMLLSPLISEIMRVLPNNSLIFSDRLVLDGLRTGILKASWVDTGEEIDTKDIPDGLSCTYNEPQIGEPDPRILSYHTVNIHLA